MDINKQKHLLKFFETLQTTYSCPDCESMKFCSHKHEFFMEGYDPEYSGAHIALPGLSVPSTRLASSPDEKNNP